MAEMLVDGGYFVNIEPTYNNIIFKYLSSCIYKNNVNFNEKTERRFGLEELNHIYISCNLKIKRQIYPGLMAYLLWNNPNVFPLLNRGNKALVKAAFHVDRLFMHNFIGKRLSVATYSVLEKI